MSFECGFFNSVNGDRKYNSEQISRLFDGLMTDGIVAHYGQKFAVTPGTGMNVVVGSGRCWFKHVWGLSDGNNIISLDPSDSTKNRIDAIVIEVDNDPAIRNAFIKVVKGTLPSGNASPAKPTMVNTDTKGQLPLAYVTVTANSTSITASKIQVVVGTSECPYITGILEGVSIDNLLDQMEGEFDEWFANVQAQLSGNVATNLQNQINSLNSTKANKTDVNTSISSLNTSIDDAKSGVYINGKKYKIEPIEAGSSYNFIEPIRDIASIALPTISSSSICIPSFNIDYAHKNAYLYAANIGIEYYDYDKFRTVSMPGPTNTSYNRMSYAIVVPGKNHVCVYINQYSSSGIGLYYVNFQNNIFKNPFQNVGASYSDYAYILSCDNNYLYYVSGYNNSLTLRKQYLSSSTEVAVGTSATGVRVSVLDEWKLLVTQSSSVAIITYSSSGLQNVSTIKNVGSSVDSNTYGMYYDGTYLWYSYLFAGLYAVCIYNVQTNQEVYNSYNFQYFHVICEVGNSHLLISYTKSNVKYLALVTKTFSIISTINIGSGTLQNPEPKKHLYNIPRIDFGQYFALGGGSYSVYQVTSNNVIKAYQMAFATVDINPVFKSVDYAYWHRCTPYLVYPGFKYMISTEYNSSDSSFPFVRIADHNINEKRYLVDPLWISE